jgi:hypothetical protein
MRLRLGLLVGLVVLAGCGSSSPAIRETNVAAISQSATTPGRLVGAIVLRGRGHNSRHHRGWVEVGQHGHLFSRQWVKTNQKYHFELAPGTYDLAGYTKYGVCRTVATIRSGSTTVQNVYCVFH